MVNIDALYVLLREGKQRIVDLWRPRDPPRRQAPAPDIDMWKMGTRLDTELLGRRFRPPKTR